MSVHGMHPAAIGAALFVAIWFVVAMVMLFSGNIETDYLMVVVAGLSAIFFTLTLGIAAHSAGQKRWYETPTSFDRFLSDDVAVHTGRITGREAVVQLLALPISLVIGATLIGLVFLIVTGI